MTINNRAARQIPPGPADRYCPLWRKAMAKVCHTCPLYINIKGKDPQSEEIIDEWGCSLQWMPKLLVENSQMQRQTGAAVESARNEQVKSAQLVAASMQQAVAHFVQSARQEREVMVASIGSAVASLARALPPGSLDGPRTLPLTPTTSGVMPGQRE